MKTPQERAILAAYRFASEKNWKQATLCMLVACSAHQHSITAAEIAEKFSESGYQVDAGTIYLCLQALTDDGLAGEKVAA